MKRDLANRIGEWAVAFEPSEPRRARIRASIRDFMACVIAGTRRPELRPALWLAHGGGVPVWGLADSFDAAGAALVTGTAGALLQLHDLYAPAGLHPSSPVIPAAWSALHAFGSRGRDDFVRAVAAGYEVTNRIGAACVPGLVQAGGAPTGSAGAVGAAVAAALVAGHDAQGIARAVRNSAMLLPLSPFAIMTTHGELAPLHSGLAARAGFEAASLARDADAGSFVLEGDATGPGLIALLRGDPAALVPESWHGETIDAIAWKFFPACFASMSALEALLRLGPIDAGSVQTLRLRMPDRMLALVASGPDSGHLYDRLMSLRWVLGRALERGGHYDASDAGVTSAVATELAQRVEVSHDPSLDALADHYSADLELTAKDGSVRRIAYRRPIDGEPEQPGPRGWTRVLDEPALQGKFRLLVRDAPTVLENLRLLRVA